MFPALTVILSVAAAQPCIVGPGAVCKRWSGVITTPGQQLALPDGELTNPLGTAVCDAAIDGELLGWMSDITFVADPITIPGVQPDVPTPVGMSIDVPSDVDASFVTNPYEEARWQAIDICSQTAESKICVIPEGDTPIFVGQDPALTPLGGWKHEMDGPALFELREVYEDDSQVQLFSDGCHEKAVAMGVDGLLVDCDPFTGQLTGWRSVVESNNQTFVIDYLGYVEDCVTEYRALGVAPCDGFIEQPMRMVCGASQEPVYVGRPIGIRIDLTTVGSKKGTSSWQDFTWP